MSDVRASDEMISSPQSDHDALRHVSPETPCPYLPDRQARTEAYLLENTDGAMYGRMLASGFRRSGQIIYRPRCRGCCECRSTRIPADRFTLSRSMRRVWRRNADLRVEEDAPIANEEKFVLFCRYLDAQHDNTMSRTWESFQDFLYDSPMETREFRYLLGERLVGVSLVDRWHGGLSSIYMYFDPDFASRSLGTYSVLWEVEYCRRKGFPYYYLGYYVAGSKTMSYKSRFRPNEILVAADRWVTFRK